MIKKIVLTILVISIFVITLWFNNNNSELITINLEFASFTYSASVIFAVILFAGWLFGLLCCSFYILKLLNERRLLRSSIKNKEKIIIDSKDKLIKDAN
jgi:uncharacterized membrane protein YciS (DUF1049 family)|tara:strand:- start:3953 stop:4249 length:297 start_codon:yes stop_codon:yes gene_type:complete